MLDEEVLDEDREFKEHEGDEETSGSGEDFKFGEFEDEDPDKDH